MCVCVSVFHPCVCVCAFVSRMCVWVFVQAQHSAAYRILMVVLGPGIIIIDVGPMLDLNEVKHLGPCGTVTLAIGLCNNKPWLHIFLAQGL